MSLSIIVAATSNNGIGQAARLPWRLPREMAYFSRVTSDAPSPLMNAVIMGRRTWESIPDKFRPLKNRINIVLSKDPDYDLQVSDPANPIAPVCLHRDLPSALARLEGMTTVYRRFVIGGASLYREALGIHQGIDPATAQPIADRILLTRITSPAFDECDVFFPEYTGGFIQGDGRRTNWVNAPHEDLVSWVGDSVPKGVQEEREVQYEFQMWILENGLDHSNT